jgi:L-alanine-DL-glutamate epimerase-like enolase superfamily enzyme
MKLRVREIDLCVSRCQARQPFRFGGATLTSAPSLLARARVEIDAGLEGTGYSADLLVPKWFDKDPRLSVTDDAARLAAASRTAAASFLRHGTWPATLFDHWLTVYREFVLAGGPTTGELVRGFGVALIERALIDAVCRAAGRSFFDALREDLLGFRPSAVYPELEGWQLAAALPERPRDSIRVRHTIGLADPLRTEDVRSSRRVSDGLPESLEEHVLAYGLDAFKVKLCGTPEEDRQRLRSILEVLSSAIPSSELLFTLDANEQYAALDDLARMLHETAREPGAERLFDNLAYIEQPLPRATAFHPSVSRGIAALADFAPVIIDESDAGFVAFERAISCGYRGVSVKNCKGVFRALLHHGLCKNVGRGLFLCSEDLTTLPIVALQQDLATVAALGLEHSERNGHHYFTRLEHLPAAEREAALHAHPDLYEERGNGPELRIHRGRIAMGSLQCIGFGFSAPIEFEARTPIEAWSFA